MRDVPVESIKRIVGNTDTLFKLLLKLNSLYYSPKTHVSVQLKPTNKKWFYFTALLVEKIVSVCKAQSISIDYFNTKELSEFIRIFTSEGFIKDKDYEMAEDRINEAEKIIENVFRNLYVLDGIFSETEKNILEFIMAQIKLKEFIWRLDIYYKFNELFGEIGKFCTDVIMELLGTQGSDMQTPLKLVMEREIPLIRSYAERGSPIKPEEIERTISFLNGLLFNLSIVIAFHTLSYLYVQT